jgi:hypothetical protein
VAGTVGINFTVSIGTSPGNANRTFTFTVFKNGATTGITCAITTAATSCTDTTHTASFAVGDKVAVQIVRSGSDTGSLTRTMTFTLDADNAPVVSNPHIVTGTVASVAVSPGTVVTLGGPAAFALATSYVCTVQNTADTNSRVEVTQQSGTQFTIIGQNAIPSVNYMCIGN